MPLNVLVVDDSSVMRKMIAKALRLSGVPLATIHEAGNGQEGLDALDRHSVDLVLADLNMPVMDGEEMIAAIRGDPETANLPVIVVSTEGSFTRIGLLRKKGAEFVHKPFTPESLRETIAEVTGVSYEQQPGEGALEGSGPDF
jgi:two-component system chemotaxis response regulator CheY